MTWTAQQRNHGQGLCQNLPVMWPLLCVLPLPCSCRRLRIPLLVAAQHCYISALSEHVSAKFAPMSCDATWKACRSSIWRCARRRISRLLAKSAHLALRRSSSESYLRRLLCNQGGVLAVPSPWAISKPGSRTAQMYGHRVDSGGAQSTRETSPVLLRNRCDNFIACTLLG